MAEEKELKLDTDDGDGGGGKSKLVIILIVLVLLVGGGGAAAMFLMGDKAEVAEDAEAGEQIQPSHYLKMRPAFVANYMVGKRQRYLQVEITLVTRNESHLELFADHMPVLQNEITAWLTQQDFEELRDPESRDGLRQSLVENLQEKIEVETGEAALEDVLFTGFVMQ